MIDEKKGTVGTFIFMQMDFNICPYLRQGRQGGSAHLTPATFEKVD